MQTFIKVTVIPSHLLYVPLQSILYFPLFSVTKTLKLENKQNLKITD